MGHKWEPQNWMVLAKGAPSPSHLPSTLTPSGSYGSGGPGPGDDRPWPSFSEPGNLGSFRKIANWEFTDFTGVSNS